MFRLANMAHGDGGEQDAAGYISSIASRTIYEALCRWCNTEGDVELIFEDYFSRDEAEIRDVFEDDEQDDFSDSDFNFFAGIGQYYTGKNGKPLSDEAAGKEILFRKIRRMKDKMQDQANYYTFDLFEEYLFQLLIEAMQVEHFCQMDLRGTDAASFSSGGTDDGDVFRIDDTIRWLAITPREKKVAETLHSRFGFSPDDAEMISMQIHRIYEMGLDEDEEDNMFFWDLDSEFLFEKGFVDGIKRCAGPEGMFLGYGYEYTEEIFTDMGMKAPIRLLGSKEANRLRFEAIKEEMRKKGL